MLKLYLEADRKVAQALKHRLPPIIDGVEPLAPDGHGDELLARSTPGPDGARCLTIGLAIDASGDASPVRLQALQARFPGRLGLDSVFQLPSRTTDFAAFDAWCATRVRTMFDFLLGEYAASQLATAALRRHARQLERSLAQAETVFVDLRREPLKLAYRAERAGTYALPMMRLGESGPRSLDISQTLQRRIANVRIIDLGFSGGGKNLQGTVRFVARGGWSGTVLCDRSLDVRDLGAGWTQFRCEPLSSGDEEPLELELRMAGADLGWLVPAFSHPSPLPEDCASIADLGSVGRPLAIQVWSGIPGIDLTAHAGAPRGDTAVAVIAPEQLSMAELASKPPAGLSFTPVSYDTATQSLLVHPLGPRPTVARLPPVSAVNLSALSAIVRLDDARARPAEFALAASAARSVRDGIDPESLIWHEFKAREWGEIEVTFPEPLNGEVRIHLLTRTRTDDFNYTSAWFRGLRMISAAPAVG